MAGIHVAGILGGGVIGACLTAIAVSGFAQQPYPNRPLRLIVPLAPGARS